MKHVIREEKRNGRQSEQYNPDLSDIQESLDMYVGKSADTVGQRRTSVTGSSRHQGDVSEDRVGHTEKVSDAVRQPEPTVAGKEQAPGNENRTTLVEENTKLKIEMAKLEEQARTKDEMMTFLRKEIDRRGDQIAQDRETYDKSLDWFRTQVTAKDAVIERLNTEMRGLLEAPRRREERGAEEPTHESPERYAPAQESLRTTQADQTGQANW